MTAIPADRPAAAASGARPLHPLIHAGRWLAADLASTLIFVALYAMTHNLFLATGVAIAGGAAQIIWLKLRRSPVDAIQWMSLGLVVVFGGASLLTRDPRFIMLKPTLIYCAIGAVMLRRGWMNRYLPPLALRWGVDVATTFGYAWAALMVLTGAANAGLALFSDPRTWATFLAVFPLGSKLALFAVQYAATRVIVRRRIRAAGGVATA